MFTGVFLAQVLSLRPSEELEKKLKLLSKFQDVSRPQLAKNLLLTGAKEELKKQAIEMLRQKKVSLGKAAEIADVSVREMLDFLKESGLELNVSKKSILADFKKAAKR